MSYVVIPPQGSATIAVPASSRIAVQTLGSADVFQDVGFPNYPSQLSLLQTVANTTWTSSAFSAAASVVISAGAQAVVYEVGTNPVISFSNGNFGPQGDPGVLNATGTLTAAMMLAGIVTSTTAAAVTATPDTGALIDGSSLFAVNDSFDFSVINTGGTNAFTISVGGGVAGITLVGNMAVAASSAGAFRVRKTAANTFTIYRIAS